MRVAECRDRVGSLVVAEDEEHVGPLGGLRVRGADETDDRCRQDCKLQNANCKLNVSTPLCWLNAPTLSLEYTTKPRAYG